MNMKRIENKYSQDSLFLPKSRGNDQRNPLKINNNIGLHKRAVSNLSNPARILDQYNTITNPIPGTNQNPYMQNFEKFDSNGSLNLSATSKNKFSMPGIRKNDAMGRNRRHEYTF
jgi:hypothetical protein